MSTVKFLNSQGQTNLFKMVSDFHEKFGIGPKPYEEHTHHDHNFRIGFMEEELGEYIRSYDTDDKAEMLDALVDLVYVCMGTAVMYGWDFNEAFRRVHAANMAKVRVSSAAESKRGHANDIRKPEGWTPPVLTDLVE